MGNVGDIKGWINFYSLAYEAGEIRSLSCTSTILVHFQKSMPLFQDLNAGPRSLCGGMCTPAANASVANNTSILFLH